MTDDVIDTADLPVHRKSLIPGAGFFTPQSVRETRRDRTVERAVEGAEAVVLADPDADGLACVAILRELYDDETAEPRLEEGTEDPGHRVALVPTGPHELTDSLERLAARSLETVDVFVCDLAPDRLEPIEAPLTTVLSETNGVRWYDHHRWDPAVTEAVADLGVEVVVGDSETECTADVLVRSMGVDSPELEELAAVTRDHDLWIREDARSQDLADLAYWAHSNAFVETVRSHGPDLPEEVTAFLESRRREKQALIDQAVQRAEFRDVGGVTVGVTYGRCSQNEVAEALRERGAALSVVVKPSGSVSLRGTDAFERCHEVAGLVEGGGHPKAAGCKPPVHDDMLDYAHHWVTRGAVTRRVLIDAIETVVAD